MTLGGQEWELRGWDDAFLDWFRSDEVVTCEILLRVIDWGVQALGNGPPRLVATPGDLANEFDARVPGTDLVVTYLEVGNAVVVVIIGR